MSSYPVSFIVVRESMLDQHRDGRVAPGKAVLGSVVVYEVNEVFPYVHKARS